MAEADQSPLDRSRWTTALTVAGSFVALGFLVDGITGHNWLQIVAAGLLLLGLAVHTVGVRRPRHPSTPQLPVDEARGEVVAEAAGGDPVRAVALLRRRTGLGLLEATRTVEGWLAEEGLPWR